MENNNVSNLMGNSFEGLKKLVDVNTIIGEKIDVGDGTTIIPISKVTFGYGLGGGDFGGTTERKNTSFAGGASGGITINPIAFLIVKNGDVQMIQVASPNNVSERALNMVPDVVDKISGIIKDTTAKKTKNSEKQADTAAHVPHDKGDAQVPIS